MRYLLDTSIASAMIRNPQGRPARRQRVLGGANAAVSVIVAAELRFGAMKRVDTALAARVEAFLEAVDIIPFDPPGDRLYAEVRADLEAKGMSIGGNDLFIAAHALALDRILVTANEREFRRIDGLTIENWLR